jgi:hypothetical protein
MRQRQRPSRVRIATHALPREGRLDKMLHVHASGVGSPGEWMARCAVCGVPGWVVALTSPVLVYVDVRAPVWAPVWDAFACVPTSSCMPLQQRRPPSGHPSCLARRPGPPWGGPSSLAASPPASPLASCCGWGLWWVLSRWCAPSSRWSCMGQGKGSWLALQPCWSSGKCARAVVCSLHLAGLQVAYAAVHPALPLLPLACQCRSWLYRAVVGNARMSTRQVGGSHRRMLWACVG